MGVTPGPIDRLNMQFCCHASERVLLLHAWDKQSYSTKSELGSTVEWYYNATENILASTHAGVDCWIVTNVVLLSNISAANRPVVHKLNYFNVTCVVLLLLFCNYFVWSSLSFLKLRGQLELGTCRTSMQKYTCNTVKTEVIGGSAVKVNTMLENSISPEKWIIAYFASAHCFSRVSH